MKNGAAEAETPDEPADKEDSINMSRTESEMDDQEPQQSELNRIFELEKVCQGVQAAERAFVDARPTLNRLDMASVQSQFALRTLDSAFNAHTKILHKNAPAGSKGASTDADTKKMAAAIQAAKSKLEPQSQAYVQFKASLALASSPVLGQDALMLDLAEVEASAAQLADIIGKRLPAQEQAWRDAAGKLADAKAQYAAFEKASCVKKSKDN